MVAKIEVIIYGDSVLNYNTIVNAILISVYSVYITENFNNAIEDEQLWPY